ncbi:ABC transporter permease [Salinispira pacifica]|uniref:ABC transmembrane type-1 domain-containing protein n=1 Tax=Salinispira pacifica TaxID=1307761 RepID=V5WMA5_9SPIO|nr:ABC transporter permease [Salinispira pacifica]AHC16276.1 hypothetical protein L21SP2_2930 [Salinispira pacifica]
MKPNIRTCAIVTASIILLSLLVMMIFAEQLAPRSPYTMQSIRSWTEDGRLIFQKAPYPPSRRFPLGSDEFGRDILSRIIHGSRITIPLAFCIVLLRFALAVPLGIRAAFGGKIAAGLIHQFSLIFNAIPALLISLIILKLELFQSLDTMASALAFTAVLAGVTWSRTAHIILERSSNILSMQFIRSEIAIGKSPWMITRKNLIPHLLPETLVLFFMEIGSALTLLMQLGIFAVFLGNLRIVRDTTNGIISYFNVSFEPEWASMLGTARNMISTAPWMVIYPALAFFITVLGFNLFAEGLRQFLPGPGQAASPGSTASVTDSATDSVTDSASAAGRGPDTKTTGRKGKRLLPKIVFSSAVLGAVILMLLLPSPVPEQSWKSFPSALTAPVRPGSGDAAMRARAMGKQFREMGMLPVHGDSYEWHPQRPAEYYQGSTGIRITLPAGNEAEPVSLKPEPGSCMVRKFSLSDIHTRGSASQSDNLPDTSVHISLEDIPLVDGRNMDLLSFSRDDAAGIRGSFLVTDPLMYPEQAFQAAIRRIAGFPEIQGVIILSAPRRISPDTAAEAGEYTEILIERALFPPISGQLPPRSRNLLRTSPAEGSLSLEFTVHKVEAQPAYITGLIQGTDPGLAGKAIMITMDYLSASRMPGLAEWQLNLIESLSGPFRGSWSYIICLTPGGGQPGFQGLAEYIDRMPVNYSDIELHINLSGMSLSGQEGLGFNRQQAPVTRTYAWSIALLMEEELQALSRKQDIPLYSMESRLQTVQYYFPLNPEVNAHFWEHGIASVFLQSSPEILRNAGKALASIILNSMYMNNHPYSEHPGAGGT